MGCTAPGQRRRSAFIAAWRRISRTFQKPYGEPYLRSRRLDSFRHLRDAPFWRRCRASGRAVTIDGTGDSLKNVVVFESTDGSLQLEATTISLILHPALFLVLVPVLYMRFLGMKIEEKLGVTHTSIV